MIRLLLIFGRMNEILTSSQSKSGLDVHPVFSLLKYSNLPLSVLAPMYDTITNPILPRTMQIILLMRINLLIVFSFIFSFFPIQMKKNSVATITNIITQRNLKISLQQANNAAKLPWLWSRSHGVTILVLYVHVALQGK